MNHAAPRLPRHFAVALALCLAVLSSRSQIPVVPDWTADQQSNTGFFDPAASPVPGYGSLGELRRAVFTAAGNYVGSLFTPAYAGEVIRVRASFSNLGPGVIGYGGPTAWFNNFGSAHPLYQPGTDYAGALANHLAGQEVAPGNTMEIILNSHGSVTFNYSTNATPPLGSPAESLFVIMAHELVHGLGFANYLNQVTGEYDGLPTAFDRLLVRGNTSPAALTAMTGAQRLAAATSNDLYWNGALAMAANGGQRVKLHAPATFEPASSMYHLDTAAYDPQGLLMLPSGSPIASSQLALVGFERAMLYDLGWTPSRPHVVSVTRDGSVSTVTFTGVLNGKYRLRHTGDLATTPLVSGWTARPETVTAGWGAAVLTHASANGAGFYVVEVAP